MPLKGAFEINTVTVDWAKIMLIKWLSLERKIMNGKALATKLGNLRSISRMHMVERSDSYRLSSDFYACAMLHVSTCACAHTQHFL